MKEESLLQKPQGWGDFPKGGSEKSKEWKLSYITKGQNRFTFTNMAKTEQCQLGLLEIIADLGGSSFCVLWGQDLD